MPVHVRRQPSMELHSAAKAHAVAQDNSDSFSFTESLRSNSSIDLPSKKQSQQKSLRLATSSTILQKAYESEEEIASPTYEDARGTQEDDTDMESELEFEDFETISANELAKAVPIVYYGKATMITITAMAPMHKRQTTITRPAKMSKNASTTELPLAIPRRSSLRSKMANRTVSMYEAPSRPYSPAPSTLSVPQAINFSTPLRNSSLSPRPSPLSSSSPPQLVPGSPSSSYADSDSSSSMDEAEALLRESEEIQIRTHSMERERHHALGDDEILGKPPTPTTYDAYDPFALQPPKLKKTKTQDEETKRWKGLGLARKVRLGRRGRDAEVKA